VSSTTVTPPLLLLGLLSMLAGTACAKKTPAPPGSTAAPAEANAAVPKRWADLHLPADGLQKVTADTNAHGYYAEYAGTEDAVLWQKLSAAMQAAGYAPACNVLDGRVRGFSKGSEKLVAKIDTIGGTLLSLFDEKGSDPMLHGVCFGKYHLGPPQKVDPKTLE
jgi:hypothetical protein